MHEDFIAIVLGDKTETLGAIKPFHAALFSGATSPGAGGSGSFAAVGTCCRCVAAGQKGAGESGDNKQSDGWYLGECCASGPAGGADGGGDGDFGEQIHIG
ncbi:hypothetical protein GCM10007052_14350 [Halioglobus japonicus]|nr:hypothetical protein GCM10007052_14350 [Halioglobus japonicus]